MQTVFQNSFGFQDDSANYMINGYTHTLDYSDMQEDYITYLSQSFWLCDINIGQQGMFYNHDSLVLIKK